MSNQTNYDLPKMTPAEYRSLDAANYSVLKWAAKSAAHMRQAMEPLEQTPAMQLGSLVDAMLLGGLESQFVCAPAIDRRTKAGKEEWEQLMANAAGRTVVGQDLWNKAETMAAAVTSHRTAHYLFTTKARQRNQQALVWKDDETGATCKALLDGVIFGTTIFDLKTTQSADARDFGRTVANFGYHVQAAFYKDGWRAMTGEDLPFLFVVVESAAPFGVACFELDESAIIAGRQRYKSALRLWLKCRETNNWPCYDQNLQTLELPKWALTNFSAEEFVDHPF